MLRVFTLYSGSDWNRRRVCQGEAGRFVAKLSDDAFNVLKEMYFEGLGEIAKQREHFSGLDELVSFIDKHGMSREGTDLENYKTKNTANNDGMKYSFAGRKAKNSDISLLQKAQSMIEDGVDSETVRKETSWFKGYDNKWRFEIDDSKVTITQSDRKYLQETSSTLLGYLIKHNELFKSYPQLRDIMVYSKDINGDGDAYYDPKFKSITISSHSLNSLSNNGLKSILIHEIQHAIQDIEGFTSGTNTDDFAKYLNTAGEIEAYDTSDRVDFTADQRKNTRPDIDRTSVVFAENGTRSLYLAGTTKEGYEVYQTSEKMKKLTYKEKIEVFKRNFYEENSPQYLGAYIKFEHDGKIDLAVIDRTTSKENTRKLNPNRLNQWDKAKINIGAEGDFITLLENTLYEHRSKNLNRAKNDAHKRASYFEYYLKTVWIDNVKYDVVVNVGLQDNGERFVYDVNLKKIKDSQPGPQMTQSYKNNDVNRRPKVGKPTRLSESFDSNISQEDKDVNNEKSDILYQARPDFEDILFDDFDGEVTDNDARLMTEYFKNGNTDIMYHLINKTRDIDIADGVVRNLVSRLTKSYELSTENNKEISVAILSLLESKDKSEVDENLKMLSDVFEKTVSQTGYVSDD